MTETALKLDESELGEAQQALILRLDRLSSTLSQYRSILESVSAEGGGIKDAAISASLSALDTKAAGLQDLMVESFANLGTAMPEMVTDIDTADSFQTGL